LIAIISLFVISGITIAYNSNPANPAVMGHTMDEIAVINETGSAVSLQQYIADQISGASTSMNCEVIYDSYTSGGVAYKDAAYKYDYGVKTFPSSCKADSGCIIKQEVYDSKGLKLVRRYTYSQTVREGDANDNWWSSYRTVGSYINGDTATTDIIPAYSYLYLRDDYYYSSGTQERDENKWTFIDKTVLYGMKVYICNTGDSEPAGE